MPLKSGVSPKTVASNIRKAGKPKPAAMSHADLIAGLMRKPRRK